uniref:Putative periplasmic binding protein n=1 Tax=uncultured marine microorganism HF4000_010I05 TaxID=455517 RepID=B3T1M7_9ZZZZ|nr:putative periplasmic binding protein [uncultured marine microorganism HF4000_010I05]
MRICSLLPSGTEILFAMGLGDQVIGVSDLCDYPPECRTKPAVCRSKVDAEVLSSDEVEQQMQRLLAAGESPYELDIQWLLKHSADVVLTQDLCYFCEVSAEQVREAVQVVAEPPQVVVLQPKTLEEIFYSFIQVGEACAAVQQAKGLVAHLRERVDSISRIVREARRIPRVFSLEGINPVVIGGHWIPDLLNLAGGCQELYPPGSPAARPRWEDICAWAPEKLYIDLCSSDLARGLREIPWLAAQEGWAGLPAVKSGDVYLIDHVYFSRPGPRIVQGLEILAQLTHPELFSGLIPPDTVAKLDPDMSRRCPASQIASCFRPYPPPAD